METLWCNWLVRNRISDITSSYRIFFGIISAPSQSAYNAAKFAVRGYTECLREELAIEGSPISCTCVHPGGIKTNIAKNARLADSRMGINDSDKFDKNFQQLAQTTPKQAARVILKGVEGNKRRVLIGRDAKVLDLMQRFLPTGYQKIIEIGSKRGKKWV